MNSKQLIPLAILATSIAALAATGETTPAQQLQIFPKNLARQHVGTNLFVFNTASQTFAPTEAAAAWLDDDISTAWPALAGKQHYLVSLAEPMLVTNFEISARPANGTITIYAGDEPAPPTSKSWSPIARDLPFDSVNHHKLARPLSRFAKYILIETDIAEPGPIYSLYLYGDKPALNYLLRKREQPIDTRSIFGPFVNNQTAFSHTGLYAGSLVESAASNAGMLGWQRAIDDNPETAVSISPSRDKSGLVVKMTEPAAISRIAALIEPGAKGRLDFFILAAAPTAGEPASVEGLTPSATLTFDGTNARSPIDFPAATGSAIATRWTPDAGTDGVTIRELNAFNDLSLETHDLFIAPEAVAERVGEEGDGKSTADGKTASNDGKSLAPVAEGKEMKDPIAAGPGKSPFDQASPIFPPNLNTRIVKRKPPEEPPKKPTPPPPPPVSP